MIIRLKHFHDSLNTIVRFEYSPWKNVFTLVKKLRSFDFKSHWNTLIFLDKKYIRSDLNISHRKNDVTFVMSSQTMSDVA